MVSLGTNGLCSVASGPRWGSHRIFGVVTPKHFAAQVVWDGPKNWLQKAAPASWYFTEELMYLCQIQEVEPCIFYVTGSFFIVLLDTFMLNIVHSYILRCIWNMQNSSINVCIIYKIPYFKTGKLVAHYFYSPNLSTHARWRRSCQVWWAWRKCYCRLMHRKQSHCFFRATSFNCNGILYTHTHTHK